MLTFVSSVIAAVVGFAAAWLSLGKKLQATQQELAEVKEQEAAQKRPEVRDLLQHIVDVATRLDGDVGRHSHRLSEVNTGIKNAIGDGASPVMDMAQQIVDANAKLRGELQAARQEISSKQRELETYVSEARTDTLTGLKNRRSFNEELDRLFTQRQRQRQGVTFSLIMVDVDHFKKFNDTYGHLAGDLVLRSVAQALTSTLREMDLVCRYGGEEFAIICPGSRLEEAMIAAERVRVAVAGKLVSLKEGNVQVTASLGVSEVIPSEIADGLVQRADEALYSAKHAGRNRVHIHDGEQAIVPEMATSA